MAHLSKKDYIEASKCYTALLQLHEGLPGQEVASFRRRCGMTLAECHIKLGNTEEAIARYSDVIDESPVFVDQDDCVDDENELLKSSVGTAFYRRAVAFQSLGLNKFSYFDLNLAIDHTPYNECFFRTLDEIKSNEDVIENDDSETSRLEQHIFIENLQESFPRPFLNSKEMHLLFRRSKARSSKPHATQMQPTNGSGLEGLFAGLGGSGIGAGGLGQLSSMLPLLGGMGLVSPEAMKNLKEIFAAVTDVFKIFNHVYTFLKKNSHYILTFIGLVCIYLALAKK